MQKRPKIIAGLNALAESKHWTSVDDVVMGGLSRSQMVATDRNTTVFFGKVSLANRGGFASVRAQITTGSLQGTQGLRMRLRGDGRRYRLRLRTDSELDGPVYEVSFQTEPDVWMEVQAPFEIFTPTYRGHRLPQMPALAPENIEQIGLMISDRQVGSFKLEIEWITAYNQQTSTTLALLQMAEPAYAA
jgi:monofunctional biosynthetic peptidoglycan transglycosylase